MGFMAGQIKRKQRESDLKMAEKKKLIQKTVAMIDENIAKKKKNKIVQKQYDLQFITDFLRHGADTSVID